MEILEMIHHPTPITFQWNLPSLQASKSIICDDEYGLLAFVGGSLENYSAKLCLLSFTSNEYYWNWQQFNKRPPALRRKDGSCIMIKTNDNKKKLFVCAGKHGADSCDIYDFSENEWNNYHWLMIRILIHH